ncbi:MAG: hypothetical protein WCG27_07815, partial [Pseudomonadota bacterium]
LEYDLSFFDTDPYEPIPGGTMSIWPFILGRFVEMPYTLVQDYTLVNVLGEKSPRLWLEKVNFVRDYCGMVLVNTHPDYLQSPDNWNIYVEFLQEMKKNQEAAKITKAIAAKLPGKGDCNPVTDTVCYCAQLETQNDPQYCLPTMKARKVAENSYQITCIDDRLKADTQCACLDSNTCYDKNINNLLEGVGFNSSFTKGAMTPANSIYRGVLTGAGTQGGSIQQAAMAQRVLDANKKNLPSVDGLSTGEEESAKKLSEHLGIPLEASRFFAAQKESPESNKFMSRFSGLGDGSASVRRNEDESNAIYFQGGSGLRAKEKEKKELSFLDRLKTPKPEENVESGSVLSFAEKSSREAQISKDKNRSIFDLVSHRYRLLKANNRLEQ